MNDAKSVFNIQQLKECSELLAPDYEEFFTTKLRSDGYVLLNILKAAKSLQPIDTRNTPAVVDANTLFCRHCGCAKPKSEFHNKKSMTGKQSYCAECQIKLMSEYRRAKIVKSLKKIPSQYTPETVPLSKFCAKCKRVLQINKFYVCATHKDGFQSYCSSCCKKYDKQKQLAKKAQIESSINSASL
jgi:hypothetical protein